jgi:CubicO group peptidase (beta-lactamase class C family)
VLGPLGMNNTHIESFVGQVMPNAAESYYFDQGMGYGNPKSNRAIFGAADVYTRIADIAYWMANFQTPKIRSESAMDLFLAPYKFNDGSFSEYGFGIENRIHKGLQLYSHTGMHESFFTQLRYYPEYDLGIVAISNFEGGGSIPTNKIAEYLLKDQMSFPENTVRQPFEMDLDHLKQFGRHLVIPPWKHNK